MPTMVKPKPTRSLWPAATPGSAGSPAPITFHPRPTRPTPPRRRGSWHGRAGSPGGPPGARRLAGADPVPPRPHQVDHPAQARQLDRPVRIVGEERLAGLRAAAGEDPVVGTFRGRRGE